MNKGKILGLLLLASTCMSNTGGCSGGGDECDGAPKCESTVMGTLSLDPVSASAIPFQGNETVTFVNPQGFQAHYKAQGFATDTDEKYVTQITQPCGNCTEHYLKERSTLKFSGANINFSYTYQRVKNTPEEPGTQSPNPGTVDDVLAVSLGDKKFALSLSGLPVKINAASQVKLHDSLLLGNKFYHQVYEVSSPDNFSSDIQPAGIYYTRQHGLVGYYFTNKELWYKQ